VAIRFPSARPGKKRLDRVCAKDSALTSICVQEGPRTSARYLSVEAGPPRRYATLKIGRELAGGMYFGEAAPSRKWRRAPFDHRILFHAGNRAHRAFAVRASRDRSRRLCSGVWTSQRHFELATVAPNRLRDGPSSKREARAMYVDNAAMHYAEPTQFDVMLSTQTCSGIFER